MIGGWRAGELGAGGGKEKAQRLQKASQMAVWWLAQCPPPWMQTLIRTHTYTHTHTKKKGKGDRGIKSKAGREGHRGPGNWGWGRL